MKKFLLGLALFISLCSLSRAADEGVVGRWTDPTGSTIEIARCAGGVCARLVGISKQAPTRFDSNNPDAALRTRALCGMEIGSGFHLNDPTHASGGTLYDPKSGKTYRGSMSSDGDKLKLRGYVGVKLFGKSQTWTRAASDVADCHL